MYHRYKKTIESELNTRFRLVLQNTRESDEANAVRAPIFFFLSPPLSLPLRAGGGVPPTTDT